MRPSLPNTKARNRQYKKLYPNIIYKYVDIKFFNIIQAYCTQQNIKKITEEVSFILVDLTYKNQINKVKEKQHMNISVHEGKTFDKFHHLFVNKNTEQTKNRMKHAYKSLTLT